MKGIMLAAGKSTRTYPHTITRPKPLLKLLDRTIIEYNLSQLAGIIEELCVVVGYKKEMIMEKLILFRSLYMGAPCQPRGFIDVDA